MHLKRRNRFFLKGLLKAWSPFKRLGRPGMGNVRVPPITFPLGAPTIGAGSSFNHPNLLPTEYGLIND